MVHRSEKFFTVILESSLLDEAQTQSVIKQATDAGVDFVKNATGTLPLPFSLDHALQFRTLVPRSVGVKIVADGATEAQLETLVAAGVERLSIRGELPE